MSIDAGSPKVLITGAAGFLGSFLVDLYAHSGWHVHGTYRHREPAFDPPASAIDFHHIDLRHEGDTRRLLDSVRPQAVLHLAAQSSVALSWQEPAATYANNILPQVNLLEVCLALDPPPRVLIMGSADEYGAPAEEENPITEEQPLRPINPYGVSKVGQDLMGYQYFQAQGLPTVRVRPFLQIGPRRSDAFVSGTFARQVAEIELGLRPAVIEVGDIDAVRDMTDVRDVARACKTAMECGRPGEVYNIASGQPRTIRSLLAEMVEIAGIRPEIRSDQSRARCHEAVVLVGDSTRIRDQTGWRPSISFTQSAADTLEFWREQVRVTIGS